MGKVRTNRIAEEIKRELSQIIRSELKDPRVSGIVSITGVEVSGDLKYAKVFVSHYGEKEQQKEVIQGLEKATGFLRSELGKRIRLRIVPELIFKLDESLEYGNKISELLSQIKEQESKNE
ncbi:MAG: 30S ribosome-binding factor RbfA [Clostridia bacterium]|nr:30S ribosome-binding factor RbfA [Clostridia bacterium]